MPARCGENMHRGDYFPEYLDMHLRDKMPHQAHLALEKKAVRTSQATRTASYLEPRYVVDAFESFD